MLERIEKLLLKIERRILVSLLILFASYLSWIVYSIMHIGS